MDLLSDSCAAAPAGAVPQQQQQSAATDDLISFGSDSRSDNALPTDAVPSSDGPATGAALFHLLGTMGKSVESAAAPAPPRTAPQRTVESSFTDEWLSRNVSEDPHALLRLDSGSQDSSNRPRTDRQLSVSAQQPQSPEEEPQVGSAHESEAVPAAAPPVETGSDSDRAIPSPPSDGPNAPNLDAAISHSASVSTTAAGLSHSKSSRDDNASLLSADISEFVSHFASASYVPDDNSSLFTSPTSAGAVPDSNSNRVAPSSLDNINVNDNDNLDEILGPITSIVEEQPGDEERQSQARADALIEMTRAAIDAITKPSYDEQEQEQAADSHSHSQPDRNLDSSPTDDQQHEELLLAFRTKDASLVQSESDIRSKQTQSNDSADNERSGGTANGSNATPHADRTPADAQSSSSLSSPDESRPAQSNVAASESSVSKSPKSQVQQDQQQQQPFNRSDAPPPIERQPSSQSHSVPHTRYSVPSSNLVATDTEDTSKFDPLDRIVNSLQSTYGESGGLSTLSPSSTVHNGTSTTYTPNSERDTDDGSPAASHNTQPTCNASPVNPTISHSGSNNSELVSKSSPARFTFDSVPSGAASAPHHEKKSNESQTGGTSTASGEPSPKSPQQSPVGGRLWEAAKADAQDRAANTEGQPPAAKKFAESLMEHTRSRADPTALMKPTLTSDSANNADAPTMVQIGETEDVFILNTVLARKRVRVVQLLIMGLVAFCFGFMGSFIVQSSCHFVSAEVTVGQANQSFQLHYGLWKYTPMDSVFQGYSYCYAYDDSYTSDAPMIPRWTSCIAMLLGTYSLCVLWYYLILGRASERAWNYAVAASGLASALQLCTLQVFAGDVCDRDECTLGPAGMISVGVSVVWLVMAFEMHYNMPTRKVGREYIQDSLLPSSPGRSSAVGSPASNAGDTLAYSEMDDGNTVPTYRSRATAGAMNEPNVLVAQLELTDFNQASKAYVRRIVPSSVATSVVGEGGESPRETLPSLNRIASRSTPRHHSEALMERDLGQSDYHSFV